MNHLTNSSMLDFMNQRRLIAITDKLGRPTGEETTLDEANNRGLWHDTSHIVLYTPDGQYLVQKRATTIVRYPGLIDVTAGGGVYVGETPEQAIVRRVYEELGVKIEVESLQKISRTTYNHQIKKYGKHVRVHLHNFIAELPNVNVVLRHMPSEVSWAGFISEEQMKLFVASGKLEHIGALIPRPKYYEMFIHAIDKKLHDQ